MRTFPQFTRSTLRSTLSGASAWVGGGAFYGEGEIFHGQFSSGEIIFQGKCLGRAYLQGNHLEGNYPGGGVGEGWFCWGAFVLEPSQDHY